MCFFSQSVSRATQSTCSDGSLLSMGSSELEEVSPNPPVSGAYYFRKAFFVNKLNHAANLVFII